MARKPSLGERVFVAVVVILAVIWLPFEMLFRAIGRLVPGAKAREARAARDVEQESAANAEALVAALAPDLAAKAGDWNETIEMLQDAARIGVIDWRSEPDELREAINPMLARHGVALDWGFIDDLLARDAWDALKNENLVPRVAAEIAKHGVVLAHIDEGSDAYVMAVLTPEAFASIDGLRIGGDAIRIRRFPARR